MREFLTPATEDCLKAIHALSRDGRANTQAIADSLSITAASVTGMLKRLNELRLIEYQPYRGAILTEDGERVALEIIRHHRLIETYLHQALGYGLEEVHAEADRLEHVISETFEARINALLGHPTHDPHGDPIPSFEGVVPGAATRPLVDLPPGAEARLGRVSGGDADLLRYLASVGLVPGATVSVLDVAKQGGTVTVRVDGRVHTLGLEVARRLWVGGEGTLPG